MATKVFSPVGDGGSIQIVDLSKAPAPPTTGALTYAASVLSFVLNPPTTDFDGTDLTGLDDVYAFGAFNNPDGTNPMDGQDANDLIANGFQIFTQSGPFTGPVGVSATVTAPVGGGTYKVFVAASDNNG